MCEGIVGDFCSTQTSHHEAIFLGAIETSLGGGLGGRGPRLSSLFRSRSSAVSSGNHLGQLAPDDERARARTAGQTLKRRLDDENFAGKCAGCRVFSKRYTSERV